jgi:RNA polymerase sigma-70 factor (ECF subfamily)
VDPGRTDEELADLARAGDLEAYGELASRHESRVYRLCLRLLRDPEDARDAAQDAFVSGLRTISSFRGDAAFTTWMHRIAVNACYDLMRRRRRRPTLHVVPDDGPVPEPGPPAADHADEVAGTIDVAAALARVPEEFRAALVLADVEDLPYDEIASILGVAVGTVKSRVHRGRAALGRELGEPAPTSRSSEEEA